MTAIKTWNDLANLGENEENRKAFVYKAIDWHKGTEAYHTAVAAQEYYNCLNPTIMHYEKVLYDMRGNKHTD